MKLSFEVDVPFEIPTLRFILERDFKHGGNGRLKLSCYFDKGRDMLALALLPGTMENVGHCAQLLAMSAAWTVEFLERWPRDEATGQIPPPWEEADAFVSGKPLFQYCSQGADAGYDRESSWPK
jgi:hypothetical protein